MLTVLSGLQEKYHLQLPPYPGASQCVRLSGGGKEPHSEAQPASAGNGASVDPSSIRLNYNLAESSGGLMEADADPDPFKQFDKWFKAGLL